MVAAFVVDRFQGQNGLGPRTWTAIALLNLAGWGAAALGSVRFRERESHPYRSHPMRSHTPWARSPLRWRHCATPATGRSTSLPTWGCAGSGPRRPSSRCASSTARPPSSIGQSGGPSPSRSSSCFSVCAPYGGHGPFYCAGDPLCAPYTVRETSHLANARPDLVTALQKWAEGDGLRTASAEPPEVPIVVVAREGGASRAAAWMLAVIGRLEIATRARGPGAVICSRATFSPSAPCRAARSAPSPTCSTTIPTDLSRWSAAPSSASRAADLLSASISRYFSAICSVGCRDSANCSTASTIATWRSSVPSSATGSRPAGCQEAR